MRWSIGMTKDIFHPPFQRPSWSPVLPVAPSLSASISRAFTSRDSASLTVSGRCHLAVCQRQWSRLSWKFRAGDLVCGASRDSRTADNEFRDDIYDFDLDWLSPLSSTTMPEHSHSERAGKQQAGVMEVPCQWCRGRGYLQCPLCDLAPHPSCNRCAGEGKLVCSACQGTRVEVVSRRGGAAEKFLPVGEEEEEVEGSLVLPPVRRRRKAGTRPELSAETRVRMSLSVKRHESATGIRAQRIREAMADPQKWAQRNAAIRATKQSPAKREEAAERKRRHFVDPANRHRQSRAMKGNTFHCTRCGQEGHRRSFCPEGGYVADAAMLGPARPYTCGLCGEGGHSRARCSLRAGGALSESRRCSLCRGVGHNRQTCPHKGQGTPTWQPRRRKKGQRTRYSCGLCGEEGHQSRTCPQRVTVEGEIENRGYTCGYCGEVGHSRRWCQKRRTAEG